MCRTFNFPAIRPRLTGISAARTASERRSGQKGREDQPRGPFHDAQSYNAQSYAVQPSISLCQSCRERTEPVVFALTWAMPSAAARAAAIVVMYGILCLIAALRR